MTGDSVPPDDHDVLRQRRCWDLNEIFSDQDKDDVCCPDDVLDSMCAAPPSGCCTGDAHVIVQPGDGTPSAQEQPEPRTEHSGWSEDDYDNDHVWKEDLDEDSCGTASSWDDLPTEGDTLVSYPSPDDAPPAAFTKICKDFVHRAETEALGTTSTGSGYRTDTCTRGTQDWVTIPLPDENDWVLLEHVQSARTYRVSTSQLRKAKARLTEESCISVLSSGSTCRCSTRK